MKWLEAHGKKTCTAHYKDPCVCGTGCERCEVHVMFAPQGFPTEMDDAADGVVAVKTIQSPEAILVKTYE